MFVAMLKRAEVPQHKGHDALSAFTFLWGQLMTLQVVKLALPFFPGGQFRLSAGIFWPLLQALACLMGVVLPRAKWSTLNLMCTSLIVLWCTGSQSNHVLLEMMVSLSVVLTYSSERSLWQAQATYCVDKFLIALYLVTALHKMNEGWTVPRYSCCTLMLTGVLALPPLRWLLPLVPMGVAPLAATATELTIPLLLHMQWRQLTAFIGCGFHLVLCQMLSPMSVYPFSALMAPIYVWVVPDHVGAILEMCRPWVALIAVVFALVSSVWTQLMASDLAVGETPFEYPPYGMWAPGVVWCNFAFVAIITSTVVTKGSPERPSVRTRRGLLPGLATFLLGLCPYLGIRNYPALAMFSNLRTEGGLSNHHFIRDDFDVIGWQRDYVTLHETDIRVLQIMQVDLAPLFTPATKRALKDVDVAEEFWITPPPNAWPYPLTREFHAYSMPFLELRRRISTLKLAANATGTVRYTRTVARATLSMPWLWRILGLENPETDVIRANLSYDLRSGGDAELEEPLPWWLATVARFRSFDAGYSPCRH